MSLSSDDSYRDDRRMTRRVLRGFSPQAFGDVRTRQHVSVSDLARLSGVAFSTIHHWEAGRRTPQIDVLAKIMEVLKTPIDAVVLISPEDRYPSDWRVMHGITQPQLAAQARLSTVIVQRIEKGEYPLSDRNAETLAGLLGISVEEYRAAYLRARTRPAGQPA